MKRRGEDVEAPKVDSALAGNASPSRSSAFQASLSRGWEELRMGRGRGDGKNARVVESSAFLWSGRGANRERRMSTISVVVLLAFFAIALLLLSTKAALIRSPREGESPSQQGLGHDSQSLKTSQQLVEEEAGAVVQSDIRVEKEVLNDVDSTTTGAKADMASLPKIQAENKRLTKELANLKELILKAPVVVVEEEEAVDLYAANGVTKEIWERIFVHNLGFSRPISEAEKVSKLCFMKTHKTASTTIGSILFRFAAKNSLRIFNGDGFMHEMTMWQSKGWEQQLKEMLRKEDNSTMEYDIVLNHFTKSPLTPVPLMEGYDQNHTLSVRNLTSFYEAIVPGAVKITSLREPVSRFVSWYHYFIEPQLQEKGDGSQLSTKGVLAQWLTQHNGEHNVTYNHQAQEFFLRDEESVDKFITTTMDDFSDLILLADRIYESLVVLRHLLNWDISDMAFLPLLKSHGEIPLLRWDGLPIKPSLSTRMFGEHGEIIDTIRSLSVLDKQLYDAANETLDWHIDALHSLRIDVDKEVAALQEMESLLTRLCAESGNLYLNTIRTNAENELCVWFRTVDLTYEASIRRDGSIKGLPSAFADS